MKSVKMTKEKTVKNDPTRKKKTVKKQEVIEDVIDEPMITIDLTHAGSPKIVIPCKPGGKKPVNEDLLKKLALFYYNPITGGPNINFNRMVPIIEGKANLSLRLIDWFVTNYAKTHNTSYKLSDSCGMFNVYIQYRGQLKGYSKKKFDPFKRTGEGRALICVKYTSKKKVTTNVAQLNFFKWAIDNHVLDYIIDNQKRIDEAMNATLKTKTPRKQLAIQTPHVDPKDEHVITFTEGCYTVTWS